MTSDAITSSNTEQAVLGGQHDMRFSVASNDTLAELDRRKSGQIDANDVRVALHQLRFMRKAVLVMSIFSIVLIIGMFASSYMAIQLAKDMGVQTGRLVDSNGRGVSTVQQVDSVGGISNTSRRLREIEGAGEGRRLSVGELNIDGTYFQETLSGFLSGKTEWVASLPDGSMRRVVILGTNGNFAWGFSGSWPYLYEWTSSCPAAAEAECVINYMAVNEISGSGTQRLLKSRADISEEGEDMERVLQSIKYPHYY